MKRQLTSNSTLRKQLQRMEQAVTPVAGINSDKLMTKRRKQVLEGKLGNDAALVAWSEIAAYKLLIHEYFENGIPTKTEEQNA